MNNNNNKNNKQDEKIERVKDRSIRMCERMKALQTKVDKFITNDFEHFSDRTQEQINELKKNCQKIAEHCQRQTDEIKKWLFIGFVLMIASTLILQIILELYK